MLSLLVTALLHADPALPPPPPPPPPPVVRDVPPPTPAPAAPPSRYRNYTGRSRDWLYVERDQLIARKPSLAPQLVVMIGSLMGTAVAAAIAIDQHPQNRGSQGYMIGIGVTCGISAALSALFLALALRERFDIEDRLAAVDEALNTAPPTRRYDPETPPPLPGPPPPPPGASR